MNAALRLQGVRLAVGGRTLIGALSATVQPGECLTLMGPSGCGKSSLLAWMAGTLDPAIEAQGRISVGETDLTPLPPDARRAGILFQDDLLFPPLSVAGNLAFALPASVRPAASGAHASNRRWPVPGWPASARATRPRGRAGSARVWPCCERCWRSRARCCSRNPSPNSMRSCATSCAASSLSMRATVRCRRCW
jgi:hypothetical protein